MKEQYVGDLKDGQPVNSLFAVSSKNSPRRYKDKNKPGLWVSFEVLDNTGSIGVKFWGDNERDPQELFSSLRVGDVISINGATARANKLYNRLEISINNVQHIGKADEYDPSDFVDTPIKNLPELVSKFRAYIDAVADPDIGRLLKSIFDDDDLMKKYSMSPAARSRHHNYVGGLLEHVLSMIAISKTISDFYAPEVEFDLLVAGCMLHDIGKIFEYRAGIVIENTVQGSLLGHISMGAKLVADHIDRLEGFPNTLRIKILHMILSHHGLLEYGSPVTPSFVEALLLHYIDNCDAQFKHALQEKNKIPDTGEEIISGVKPFGTMYLK